MSTNVRITKPGESLSMRETQVLSYIGKGFRLREIGQLLGIKHHTVIDYSRTLYKKLDINSQAEAGIEAYKRGLV